MEPQTTPVPVSVPQRARTLQAEVRMATMWSPSVGMLRCACSP